MLKLFIPVLIYIGAIVGAGFASGTEIAVFFGLDPSGFAIPVAGFSGSYLTRMKKGRG